MSSDSPPEDSGPAPKERSAYIFRKGRGEGIGVSSIAAASGPGRTCAEHHDWPQNRKRNHPRPREMDTSHINKVKAPQHLKTRRSDMPCGIMPWGIGGAMPPFMPALYICDGSA